MEKVSEKSLEQPRSWNTHALLTRMALDEDHESMLRSQVQVTAIEEFFTRAQDDIARSAKLFRDLVSEKTGCKSIETKLSSHPSATQILETLRLNPTYMFSYVRILRPEEVSPLTLHDPGRNGPPGGMYVPTAQGTDISVIDILSTYADEPDWGMDQNLFPIDEYGFGKAPFGMERGKSSQAPFHMAFLHEHVMVGRIVPDLKKSFMSERITFYFALARIAFSHGIHYWGWRFTAWAMHYLQDLTQPYHAKAWPVVIRPLIAPGFLLSKVANRTLNLGLYLKNHHLLFEAVIHFMLNKIVKEDPPHPFRSALLDENHLAFGNLALLMAGCSDFAANHAGMIDSLLVRLILGSSWKDPEYFFVQDRDFHVETLLPEVSIARPHLLDQFVELVSKCLAVTGQVTRDAVRSASH
ncbi:hypothetical protein [Desulfomonile tiedjei]|uniref:Uncharacterized protein n=1 Tax=Desulfomonile tiedjei (strain ATCC 49306 / DSM 6799 / DCB-1) TaxID=706587 RepID=I4C9Z5_DESTA|nr:hypothetical protein [Desulfomonile tiedjei]AFM26386.1 hypothetical protein Desti_3742 [Desulfomonile tiedjei DSM 6799]